MKRFNVLFLCICLFNFTTRAQNVGINATGAAPDPSAMLDVASTTKGFLPPHMLASDRTGILLPATGLIVFQTDGTPGLYCNMGTPGTPNWQSVRTAPAYVSLYSSSAQP